MANQEHLNVLKQGVEDWNRWRRNHPDFSSANLREADFRGTNFEGVNLRGANLERADLRGVDLRGANIRETNLRGANFEHVKMGRTVLGNLDLRGVKGLEMLDHKGPSTIGADTILHSKGEIPEVFLRGVGLDNTFIHYVLSLANKPIQYCTCFISYSSHDQAFAERLYVDLQAKNVRCWFAPKDLKGGDKFWHHIDESIRLYDKLLVILSKNSIASVWVENEVMAALEKEHKQPSKTVLFPIRIDHAVMETDLPWAANMRRTRYIVDFTQWKEHDEYQKKLTKLLRDLNQHPDIKDIFDSI